MWKEAALPKTSSIHTAVSIELRLVIDTDRQTQGQYIDETANTRAGIALRG